MSEFVWQNYAACSGVDPDLFFPERGANSRQAKNVCNTCPVKAACLNYALDNNERFGIWGGHTAREHIPLFNAWQCAVCYRKCDTP